MNKIYKLVGIGKAAAAFGVTPTTLRRWEREGRITPERTLGGQRRYDLEKMKQGPQRPDRPDAP
jgi:DNA-binding transcriptional MerR regulator